MTQEQQTASHPVRSNQSGLHPRLIERVQRHLHSSWQKPPRSADAGVLFTLERALAKHHGPVVLDSFCGTGQSTAELARRHPDALVIGVDKSAHRLQKHQEHGDYLLLRAHCEEVWRQLAAARRRLHAHYLLYPNPWPKAEHLGRRVHGHPAFPLLLQLGGTLELRSNWQVYLEEFGVALHLAGHPARIGMLRDEGEPMTLFERKYRNSGQALWQLTATLERPAP